jgi:hypothetical protein
VPVAGSPGGAGRAGRAGRPVSWGTLCPEPLAGVAVLGGVKLLPGLPLLRPGLGLEISAAPSAVLELIVCLAAVTPARAEREGRAEGRGAGAAAVALMLAAAAVEGAGAAACGAAVRG